MYGEPNTTTTTNKKINPKDLDDAARTIQREESKLCDGETPSSGAGIMNHNHIDFYHFLLILIR
jgi:hypothetical protein